MKSYWMWYPGDYEIYHTMQMHLRRDERYHRVPAFWRISSPEVNVTFSTVSGGGWLIAHANGDGYVSIDQKRLPLNTKHTIPDGRHKITVTVAKPGGLPSVFVESDVCPSGDGWQCNTHSGDFLKPGMSEQFTEVNQNPELFPFEYKELTPLSREAVDGGFLYDYGRETFCRLTLTGVSENTLICYGESREEALDPDNCIVLDQVKEDSTLKARAFRYLFVSRDVEIKAEFEYLPLTQRGEFRCENPLLNQIYDTSVYTFFLNCRECFLDGIKRDRWAWSGDAYQSGKINSYLYADGDIVKRTALGLFGKSPVVQHINTIVDYSFFWIIGLYEYYMTYGDEDFIRQVYPQAVELIAFCESRLNADGFIEGIKNDWTFIDWSDFDMTGAMSAEQILFIAAYKAASRLAEAIGEKDEYSAKAKELTDRVNRFYWDEEKGGFIDSYSSGKRHITRHANIFAILYGIATAEQVESIVANVLKNDGITQITTPYFKGYELDAWAMLGEFDKVEEIILSYWGEMISLGATTVWEEFDPAKKGAEHYGMYDDKFGKSLCHAWGAGSVYIFGKYYLGVSPTSAGYKTFEVKPNVTRLGGFEGRVPVRDGEVRVKATADGISVTATVSGGVLIYQGKEIALEPSKEYYIDKTT